MTKLLQVKNLSVNFELKKSWFRKTTTVHAVDDISFDVYAGETIGIVGESGSGKSTLARSIVGLNKVTAGEIIFDDKINIMQATAAMQHKLLHKHIQYIFQDPIAALNPRMTVLEIISEPLIINYPHYSKEQVKEKVLQMMSVVGLSANQLERYASEFSGGQCQRIGIARALILEPKLLICDESVSALDASIKAQILNLLQDLQKKFNLTIIFISHDLSVIKHICDRVMVMYLGKVMELSSKENLYKGAKHPYTTALLAAILTPNLKLVPTKNKTLLEGDMPSPINPPLGCVFSTRCPKADSQCKLSRPPLQEFADGTFAACYKIS
ncbi:MAG: ATP-binding cassette domain-containing protein [Burkholderiales bacterium]|jgi:oligopeptide transport system ATP-binding protein|nr:ATP-binding cassette domain-containing protein [Burkholderiales bacterium]